MQGIHPWIHRSHLRIYLSPDLKAFSGLPEPSSKEPVTIEASGQEEWEVEKIPEDQIYRNKHQFLIHHQQKDTLRQIRRRCALRQATSLLRSLRPVRAEISLQRPISPDATSHGTDALSMP